MLIVSRLHNKITPRESMLRNTHHDTVNPPVPVTSDEVRRLLSEDLWYMIKPATVCSCSLYYLFWRRLIGMCSETHFDLGCKLVKALTLGFDWWLGRLHLADHVLVCLLITHPGVSLVEWFELVFCTKVQWKYFTLMLMVTGVIVLYNIYFLLWETHCLKICKFWFRFDCQYTVATKYCVDLIWLNNQIQQ